MLLGELLEDNKKKKTYEIHYTGKAYVEADSEEDAWKKFHDNDIKCAQEIPTGMIGIVGPK